MNKGIAIAFLLLLYALPATAAEIPSGYPPALAGMGEAKPGGMAEIDYISSQVVPLTDKEKKALGLSDQWARHNIDPVLASGGKVVYVHGASLPTVVASPMQVCDVELEPGEVVNEFMLGDSARWLMDTGTVGTGANAVTHLFIKPVDAGLETNAVITTDRRVYHLRLVSQRKGHTPYVGFLYASTLRQQAAARQAKAAKDAEWQSTTIDGHTTNLASLNFNYSIKGKASWKPERVYDNGEKMYVQLPKTKNGEMPVLLVRKSGKDVLVNYRVWDNAMEVDGVFDHLSLVIGVGSDKEMVEIKRGR